MSRTESLAQQLPTILASDADFCFSSPEDAMVALGSSLNPSALADREQLLRHIETLTFHNQRMALALIAHTPNGQRLLDEFRSYGGVSCLPDESSGRQQYHLEGTSRQNNHRVGDISSSSSTSQQQMHNHSFSPGVARSDETIKLDAAAQELAFRHMRQANVRLGMFYETMRERLSESEAENKKMEQLVLSLKARLESVQGECSLAQGAETKVTAQQIEIHALRKSEAELRRRVQLLESTSPTVTVVRGGQQQQQHHHHQEEILEFASPAETKNARTQTDEASIIYFSTPHGSSGSTAMFSAGTGAGATASSSSAKSMTAMMMHHHHQQQNSNSNTSGSGSGTSFHSASLVQCLLAEVEEEEAKERQRICVNSGNAPALRRRIFSLEAAGLEQAYREEENVAYTNKALFEAHRNVLLLEDDNAALRRTAEALEKEVERVAVEAWKSTSEKLQSAMGQVRRQIQERIDDAYLSGQKEALALVSSGVTGGSSTLGARPFSSSSLKSPRTDDSDDTTTEDEEEDIDDFAIRRHHRLSPRQRSGNGSRTRTTTTASRHQQQQQQPKQTTPRNNSTASSSSKKSPPPPHHRDSASSSPHSQHSSSTAAPPTATSPVSDSASRMQSKTTTTSTSNNNSNSGGGGGVPPLAMPPLALGQLRENLKLLDSIDQQRQQQQQQQHSARSQRYMASSSASTQQQQPLPFAMQSTNLQSQPTSARKAVSAVDHHLLLGSVPPGTTSIGNMSSIDGDQSGRASAAASDFEEIVL